MTDTDSMTGDVIAERSQATRRKWDRAAPLFDVMAGEGAEKRWHHHKQKLFARMGEGQILFLALGTGLDIPCFPPHRDIIAIDISPEMIRMAQPRLANYNGSIDARVMDVHQLDFDDNRFDQVFTSCTFCSVPDPVEGLRSLYRVLKPGGELLMFEHTGSRYFPINVIMHMMTPLSSRFGPAMNRPTVDNVRRAGFDIVDVEHVYLDVVKIIRALKPTS